MIFNKEEQAIFKKLSKVYTLPMGMGIVSICNTARTPNNNDIITYSLGFKKQEYLTKKGRKMLFKAAEVVPLQVITKINYILYIRSIEYKKSREEETCTIRLGVDYN